MVKITKSELNDFVAKSAFKTIIRYLKIAVESLNMIRIRLLIQSDKFQKIMVLKQFQKIYFYFRHKGLAHKVFNLKNLIQKVFDIPLKLSI